MPVNLIIHDVTCLAEGLWVAPLKARESAFFEGPADAHARYGIVLAVGASYDNKARTLAVRPFESTRIARGDTDAMLFVAVADAHEEVESRGNLKAAEAPGSDKQRDSISCFLAECRAYGLAASLVTAAKDVLVAARDKKRFELLEGAQRKWTASPNFIALTIQNRNRQLLVSVKGDPARLNYSTISPKVSRRPYCEFHFRDPSQLSETKDIVLRSIDY